MATDSGFVDYVLDCMRQAGMGAVQRERLFGGSGLRIAGELFAVVLRNTLYFVVDDQTRPRFAAAGMGPFTYARKNEQRVIPRWYELPEDVLMDSDELRNWMRDALAAARRTAKPARAKPAKPKAAKSVAKSTVKKAVKKAARKKAVKKAATPSRRRQGVS
jgi:DNA transformation protein